MGSCVVWSSTLQQVISTTQSYYYQGDNMTMDREIMTAVIRINQFQQNPYNDGSNFSCK